MIDEKALELLEEQQRKEAQRDFLKFLIYCKPDFVIEWYHRYVAQVLNEFVFGDIDYLMIFMPPRHGKSEMVSRHLPAFIHGNFPNDEIMAASYNDSLAGDMCMDVQKVMDSVAYKEIFPGIRIPPPKVSYTKGIRNSEEHHIVGHKGKYRGQGVGGSFTGKGANWICFPSGVKVATIFGEKDISEIKVNDKVWTYNHRKEQMQIKKVEAVYMNGSSVISTVKTIEGRRIRCTPDHPFYSVDKKDYVKAEDLKLDNLMAFVGFDKVESVETKNEIETVYDIKVEGNHNFYADGILVHNCVDDPIKGRETADSAAFRERLWNFWNNDLFTRRETDLKTGRKAKALITLTRWHEDDLAGRLLENMAKDPKAVKWKVILFPAIKEDNSNPDDPRQVGEALWPAKFNITELQQIRSSIGDRAWGSLYQQDPTPIGGAIFAPRMFKYGKVPDSYDYTFITADTAYKDKQENDFTAFTHFGVVNKQLYVIKVYRKQIKAVEIEDDTRPFIEASLEYGFRALLVEPKGHGIYLNQKWASRGYMIPGEDFLAEFFRDRKHDKVERAHNIIGHLAYRHIIINEDIEDKEDLVRQCTSFPKVAHDDFVDTLIDGVKYVYGTEISMFDLL